MAVAVSRVRDATRSEIYSPPRATYEINWLLIVVIGACFAFWTAVYSLVRQLVG
jgi:hypothetical protein